MEYAYWRSEATGTRGEVKKIKVTQSSGRKRRKQSETGGNVCVIHFVVRIEINLESDNWLVTGSPAECRVDT